MVDRPYFMSDPEWYTFDEEQFRYVLTDKATDEAAASYREFYGQLDGLHKNELNDMIIQYAETFNECVPVFMMPSMSDDELKSMIAESLASGKPIDADVPDDPMILY